MCQEQEQGVGGGVFPLAFEAERTWTSPQAPQLQRSRKAATLSQALRQ